MTSAPAAARAPAPSRSRPAPDPGRAGARPETAPALDAAVLRRCACGGGCPGCRGSAVHPKLAINTPGDAFEREADAAAEAVMSASPAPASTTRAPPVLRRCACGGSCPSCRKEKGEEEELHREDAGAGDAPGFAPPVVHEVLSSAGRPLDAPARAFMEQRFGADFSGVRVHDDARAAESARAVDAHAYTVGSDLVFGAGRYAPGTSAGDRLLAHELAHVVQGSPKTLARKAAAPPGRDPGLRRAGGALVLRRKESCTPNASGKCRFACPKPANGPDRWCTPTQFSFVSDAEDKSVTVADKAWANLDAVESCPGDDARVKGYLMTHFKVDAASTDAGTHVKTIFAAFTRIMGKVGVVPDCEPGSASGGTDDAKVRAAWRPLTGDLCFDFYPSYFDKQSAARAPITILHEKAHSLAGKDDTGGYEGDQGYPGKSTAEALRNADSYANFMRDMAALTPAPACKGAGPSPAPPQPGTPPQLQRQAAVPAPAPAMAPAPAPATAAATAPAKAAAPVDPLTADLSEAEWRGVNGQVAAGYIGGAPLSADPNENAERLAVYLLCGRLPESAERTVACVTPETMRSDPRVQTLKRLVAARGDIINWVAVPREARMLYVMRKLVEVHEFPENAAAGLVGNFSSESRVVPQMVQGGNEESPMAAPDVKGKFRTFTPEEVRDRRAGKSGPSLEGVGLAQWSTPDRRQGLFEHQFRGVALGTAILFNMEAQIDYVATEIKTQKNFEPLKTALWAAASAQIASDLVLRGYENPADIPAQVAPRGSSAARALTLYQDAKKKASP